MTTKPIARIPVPPAAKKGKVWPRLPVNQVIDEPAHIVGDRTGKQYASLAEDAPEAIRIIRLGTAARKRLTPAQYRAGGMVADAPSDAYRTEHARATQRYAAGGITADVNNDITTQQQQGVDAATLAREQSQAATAQQGADLSAQNVANQQAVNTAAMNTQDKQLVGEAQTIENDQNQDYSKLGVPIPTAVDVAPGAQPLGSGALTTSLLQTQQQQAQQVAQRSSAVDSATYTQMLRQQQVNAANDQIAATQARLAGTNARAAAYDQSVAGTASAGASGGSTATGAGSTTAAKVQEMATPGEIIPNGVTKTMPLGYARNPDTGRVEPVAQAKIDAANGNAVYDPVDRTYTTQGDIKSRTDQYGNVRRTADGVLVSPQGNELRNGVWTDPKTGNTLVNPTTWQNAQGTAEFHITDSKTGAGYWETPDGFTLGADGVWENKVTGEQLIPDGRGGLTRHSAQELSANRSTKQAVDPALAALIAGYNNNGGSTSTDTSGSSTDTSGNQYDANGDLIATP